MYVCAVLGGVGIMILGVFKEYQYVGDLSPLVGEGVGVGIRIRLSDESPNHSAVSFYGVLNADNL